MIFQIGDIIACSYSSEPRQGVRDVKSMRQRTQSGMTQWKKENPPSKDGKLSSRIDYSHKKQHKEAEIANSERLHTQKENVIHDPYPQILVLHNNWSNNVHGINLNQMSQQEINYLTAIIDPFFAEEIIKRDARIRAELQRIPRDINILSPHDFYIRFVKGFIKLYDGYRLYSLNKMLNIKVVKRYSDIQQRLKAAGKEPQKQQQGKIELTPQHSSFFDRYVQSISRLRGPRMK